jgi:hypothetical protein
MTITFTEVVVMATYRWNENGKKRQKTKKFYQTISPFNKNLNGEIKTIDEIYLELYAERDAWIKRCEEGEGL